MFRLILVVMSYENCVTPSRMSMELSNYLVSWVVTYLGDLQPTYIGVIIYLLSTMDILVVFQNPPEN